jgi:hypothetical protein
MKKTPLTVLVLVMVISGLSLFGGVNSGGAQTSTQVSGIIGSDTLWTPSGSPYVLTGNTLVAQGVTMTIQPGVTVNLGDYYIQVNGTLSARGTSDNPVHINGGSIIFKAFANSWNEQTAQAA